MENIEAPQIRRQVEGILDPFVLYSFSLFYFFCPVPFRTLPVTSDVRGHLTAAYRKTFSPLKNSSKVSIFSIPEPKFCLLYTDRGEGPKKKNADERW